MMKSIPPMNEMFDMAGMDLPSYLGSKQVDKLDSSPEVGQEVEQEEKEESL